MRSQSQMKQKTFQLKMVAPVKAGPKAPEGKMPVDTDQGERKIRPASPGWASPFKKGK